MWAWLCRGVHEVTKLINVSKVKFVPTRNPPIFFFFIEVSGFNALNISIHTVLVKDLRATKSFSVCFCIPLFLLLLILKHLSESQTDAVSFSPLCLCMFAF